MLARNRRWRSAAPVATSSCVCAWTTRCSRCQRSAVDSPLSIRSSSPSPPRAGAGRPVDLVREDRIVYECDRAVLLDLEEPGPGRVLIDALGADMDARRARLERRDQRRVARQHADLTGRAGHDEHLRLALERRALRRDERDLEPRTGRHPWPFRSIAGCPFASHQLRKDAGRLGLGSGATRRSAQRDRGPRRGGESGGPLAAPASSAASWRASTGSSPRAFSTASSIVPTM